MGHELIPDVLDKPPLYPLELTYKTIRTYPGMKLTADLTRFKPMLHWPANRNSIYTVVMSNLDINNRKNRYVYKYIFKKIVQTIFSSRQMPNLNTTCVRVCIGRKEVNKFDVRFSI